MLVASTCLWDANDASKPFSRCYDETWANRLYAGFKRNLTVPFRFVVWTDRERQFAPGIEQRRLSQAEPHYGACIEPFQTDEAQIFCGLDTVIVGNCDHFAEYCLTASKPAIPRDPYNGVSGWARTNAVVLAPRGCKAALYDGWAGENDMDWINTRDTALIEDLFPRQIVSFKGRVQWIGVEDETRIVYFHGSRKPWELTRLDWIKEHWLGDDSAEAAA